MKQLVILFLIVLCPLGLLSQISFAEHTVTDNIGKIESPNRIKSSDIDGDGDLDIVTIYENGKLSWFKNNNGLGVFNNIPSQMLGSHIEYFSTNDMDGDGDTDIVVAKRFNNSYSLEWYRNTSGQGYFGGNGILIDNSSDEPIYSLETGDIDNDGDFDILAANNGSLVWYRNDGQGNFILNDLNSTIYNRGSLQDIDNDGDLDVFAFRSSLDVVIWYENTGNGNFGDYNSITTTYDIRSIEIADLDNDGDLDVLSISDDFFNPSDPDTIFWLENLGMGNFASEQIINSTLDHPYSLKASDLDNDGDLDILTREGSGDNNIYWIENMDGLGSFSSTLNTLPVDDMFPFSVLPTDIDNDGDVDVFACDVYHDAVGWYKNTGQGNFDQRKIINSLSIGYHIESIKPSDLDNDSDLDIVVSSDNKIVWFENTDGLGSYSPLKLIALSGADISCKDMDGDNDIDVFFANLSGIGWYKNTGNGEFDSNPVIVDENGGNKAVVIDINNDGNLDIIKTVPEEEGTIVCYKNIGEDGSFATQELIYSQPWSSPLLFTVDLDSDGDYDLLVSLYGEEKLVWFENIDGLGNFSSLQLIDDNYLTNSIYSYDLDGDGDNDILSTPNNSNFIVWYENTDGNGNFGASETLTFGIQGYTRIFSSDIDNDGDLDLLTASANNNIVAWYENTDGNGDLGPRQIISDTGDGVCCINTADIDNDGDLDVVSGYWRDSAVKWNENLSALSVDENSLSQFSIYPNPTTGYLNIEYPKELLSITVFNQIGQKVLTFNNTKTVDISSLANGMYFVKLKAIDGATTTKKVVKN